MPNPRFTRLFPEISGNTVNGLGETEVRQASPFFWHPVDKHAFGALQQEVIAYHRRSPEITEHYSSSAPRGPRPAPKAPQKVEKAAAEWSAALKQFVLAHEGDLVGIAAMDPLFLFQGYDIPHPWLVMIGVTMEHEKLAQVPPTFENPTSAAEVARQYNRAARVCRNLANYILSQGYAAEAYTGPFAKALNMIPAAIAAGLGQLGKHGQMINRTYGSSFRLSAVSTDMPLLADAPDEFGSDEFCISCKVCSSACPPAAIYDLKQMVRGVEKWYVDFDKCIPYFGEALDCGICIAKCPYSIPGVAPRLAEKMLRRRAQKAGDPDLK